MLFTLFVWRHVAPASSVRNVPPVVPRAWMTAYTVFGRERHTLKPMRPSSPVGRPLVSFVQVFAPSVVFQIAVSVPAGRKLYALRSR